MSRERDQILGHSDEADGIEEYDNALPTWWLGLLYVCILFAAVYSLDYHFLRPRSEAGELEAAVAARPKPAAAAGGGAAALANDAAAIEAGKAIFQANCVACHGADMHGGVGPNLTDTTWIHGGKIDEIEHTITVGVPEKGMLTWGPILGPEKIAQVAAFVHSSGGGQ
jgi:cytochrome c oxidase cbb3-type subunit 3